MNLDPLADASYSLTPYRYAGNNPILFSDPNGLWEFTYDKKTKKLSFNREEGDDYKSFSAQTGLNQEEAAALFGLKEDAIVGFLDNEENSNFGTKDFKGKRGKTLKGIEKALGKGNKILASNRYNLGDNCWNSSICLTSGSRNVKVGRLSEDAEIDPRGDRNKEMEALQNSLYDGPNFDKKLIDGYISSSSGKLGDVIRYSSDGGDNTSHGSIFLLNKNNDLLIFTKNGQGNMPPYKIMLESKMLKKYDYGMKAGLKSGNGAFHTSKNQ